MESSRAQILDPVYAATAFAYAQREPRARAGAAALTGEVPAALTCSWLVAHASRLGIDLVTFDGRTWTPSGIPPAQ